MLLPLRRRAASRLSAGVAGVIISRYNGIIMSRHNSMIINRYNGVMTGR